MRLTLILVLIAGAGLLAGCGGSESSADSETALAVPWVDPDGDPPYIGSLTRHVFETLAFHAQIALHVRVLSSRDPHHLVEAQFKAFARALRDAVAIYPARTDRCTVDGEVVRPQAGGFYGGWVTDDVVGPFKGDPGTRGW